MLGLCGYLVGLGAGDAADRASRSASPAPRWSGGPSIPIALVVLAIAQMGVHLVFFLHITTGPGQHQQRAGAGLRRADRLLLIVGSLWIMANMNHNMMPMDQMMQMQR